MSELTGDPYGYGATPSRGRRGVLASAAGAAVALAGIAGLAIWAEGLLTRDPSEIPFLRAEGGPMKIAPEDPGGLALGETERAVTRMLEGERARPVTLAPAPEGPAAEDLPGPMLRAEGPGAAAALDAAPGAVAEDLGDDGAEAEAEAAASPIDAAVAAVLAEGAGRGAPASSAEAAAAGTEAAGTGSEAAPASTPVARARPAAGARGEAAVVAAAPAASVAAAAPAAARTGALAPGDVAVQLGAFNSEEIAAGQWRRHLGRNEDLLGRYAPAITTVRSGGRVLWRLRAGPLPSVAAAQELCEALKARDDACIVARVR